MDTLSFDELEDFKKQTRVLISMPQSVKEYKWPKKSGNFGEVGLARNMYTGQFVAYKKIKGDNVYASMNESDLQKDLEGQPHLMPLFDFTKHNENDQSFILQYMLWAELNGRELKEKLAVIQQPELFGLDESIKSKVLIHIGKALLIAAACMHKKNIYHRDVKSENVLFDNFFRVYLSDFGQAKYSDTKELHGEDADGDYRYQSPENLDCRRKKSGTYDGEQSDGWGIGLILLEIGGYFDPVEHFHRDIKDLTSEYTNYSIANVAVLRNPKTDSLFALIKGLLHPDPKMRLPIKAALDYAIFQDPSLQFTSDKEQTEVLRLIKNPEENASFNSFTEKERDRFYKRSPEGLQLVDEKKWP